MYYVPKESQIKTERTKLLLKYGKSCDSCEHFDYNCKEPRDHGFYGFSEACMLTTERGLDLPETRTCDSWVLAKLKISEVTFEDDEEAD